MCPKDLGGGPVVKASSSNAGDEGSIRGQGAKIPHASWSKNQNMKKSNIITNSIKNFFRKKNCVSQPRGFGEESYDEHGSMVGLPITIKLCAGPAVL